MTAAYLDTFKQLLFDLEQRDLFGGSVKTEADLEALCIDFLKSRDYSIVKKPVRHDLKSVDDLIDYFYNMYAYYKGNICKLVSNRDKDRAILSNFVKKRSVELSISYKEALIDTALIIEGLFQYEEQLNLKSGPTLALFGWVNCKWVTDKVINLLNSNEYEFLQLKAERKAKLWSEREAKNYKGFDLIYKK